jgi:hypothetical protein
MWMPLLIQSVIAKKIDIMEQIEEDKDNME